MRGGLVLRRAEGEVKEGKLLPGAGGDGRCKLLLTMMLS